VPVLTRLPPIGDRNREGILVAKRFMFFTVRNVGFWFSPFAPNSVVFYFDGSVERQQQQVCGVGIGIGCSALLR
jgi:hypothetical protein